MIVFWYLLFSCKLISSSAHRSHTPPPPQNFRQLCPFLKNAHTFLSISFSETPTMSTMKHHYKYSEGNPLGLGACSTEKNLGLNSYNLSSNSLMDMETAVAQVGQKKSKKGAEKNGQATNNGCVGDGGGESEHEMHIWTERERRKKMRNMFSSLHSLLPQLHAKADKSTIVDEAVKYIKTLQQTFQTLQKQKLEKLQGTTIVDYEPSSVITSQTDALESREAFLAVQGPSKNFPSASNNIPYPLSVPLSPACFQTWFSPNVVMNMCGDDAQISVCSVRKPGLLTTIFYILEKHNLDVVSAHVSSDEYHSIYMIHVHAGGASDHQYPEALSVEDTFKLAAGEMNLWILSC